MSMKDFWSMVTQDKKEQERAKAAKQITLGVGLVIVAAAAGVATGILLAPKSGKETRENLMQSCKDCITHQACTPEKDKDGDAEGNACDTKNA